jgi:hypothetical protein
VSKRIVVLEQNAFSQFASPFTRAFLTQTSQYICIVRTVNGMTLLKIVNYDYPLTIAKKIEAIIFPVDDTLLNFFDRVSQCASMLSFF